MEISRINEEYYNRERLDHCLLIGNGLNRTLTGQIAWGDLLSDLAVIRNVSYCNDIPMPLEFERIINEYLSKSSTPSTQAYIDAKCDIASVLNPPYNMLSTSSVHYELKKIQKLDGIITTNYDQILEYVLLGSVPKSIGTSKNKYLMQPTYQNEKSSLCFYHAHGVVDLPDTICLGYEHYAGLVEKLRHDINTKEQVNKRMIIEQILSGSKPMKNTWGERFYTSNISIIGLGLPDCEIDLWWLLAHRAYLYYSDYAGVKQKITNAIDYYDIINDRATASEGEYSEEKRKERDDEAFEKNYKYRLLKGFHVNVELYYLSDHGGSYENAYRAIIDRIAQKYYQ